MASTVRFPTSRIPERDAMLADAFAFDGDPFAADLFVPLPAHAGALDALRTWIGEMRAAPARPDRLAVLTGEEGSGKSLLLGELLRTIDDDRLHLVRLPDVPSHRTDAQLLKAIIVALDADPAGRSGLELRAEVRDALRSLGRKGMQTGLLIDDADFKGSQLELIRNVLRDAEGTGFWIILAGTPDLQDRMRRRRSLRGLMGPAPAIDEIPDADLARLVIDRIGAAGAAPAARDILPAPSLAILSGWAEGNPARMLGAARAALLAAAGAGLGAVSEGVARETVRRLTIAEANETRAEVAAATERPIQAQMALPASGASSPATTQRRLWDGEDSV